MILALLSSLHADPCGMVWRPPPWQPKSPELIRNGGRVLEREGAQRTWIAYADGIETMVLRPGFTGSVDEFGMLIPFPSPPTLRKVDENVFSHVEAAVDPPAMTVDIEYPPIVLGGLASRGSGMGGSGVAMGTKGEGALSKQTPELEPTLGYHEVRILREEAVGMYEVAVIEAGSPEALSRWMGANDFAYPEGMDATVAAYIESKWCFVAIKAKVGDGDGATPRPGMRTADTDLPEGATFDGFVQAMGFRFEVDEPVVPMRLSVFNGEAPRNVLYMLTEQEVAIRDLDRELVVRQVPGADLASNLEDPIPFWFRNGRRQDVRDGVLGQFRKQRDPERFNGVARELIASDLLAFESGELALGFEEAQTELLNISEALGLRGVEIDARHADHVAEQRDEALEAAMMRLDSFTLTVFDGTFDAEVLARQNLDFEPYVMPEQDNTRRLEGIKPLGPIISVPARPGALPFPRGLGLGLGG
ncbi:MAG: DUF2330 domain-containing protein [Proteobacteria bacterium]|nr:DUF2330 domain-containing protein [Pseudomonadota bacterium]MCP4921060.1 DUF2330 domain-containing protein [Pseudomonadota bacterium]